MWPGTALGASKQLQDLGEPGRFRILPAAVSGALRGFFRCRSGALSGPVGAGFWCALGLVLSPVVLGGLVVASQAGRYMARAWAGGAFPGLQPHACMTLLFVC